MEHAISFPALGLDFNINRVAVNLFGKDIYWYGIIICLGFVLAALYVNRRTKEFGVTSDNLMDCLIICVPVGIICARIYYVAFEWGYYSQHPNEIIAIWKGGIAIYGAVIGVVIALAVYSRIKKLSFTSLCDLAAFGLLIGQCIGRWGNFVNGEAHGGATSLPWGMSIDGASPVHPTFLYESLWNFAGFPCAAFLFEEAQVQGRNGAAVCSVVRSGPCVDRGPADGQPVSRPGARIAAAGRHKLHCGDCCAGTAV